MILLNAEINNWKRYKSLTSVINGDIYTLDPDLVCSANPVTFVVTLNEFLNAGSFYINDYIRINLINIINNWCSFIWSPQ